jgi:hypothetical protein
LERFRTSFLNIPFLKLLFFVAAFVFAIAFIPFIGSVALVLLPVILFFNGIVNGKVKTSAAFLILFCLFFPISFIAAEFTYCCYFYHGDGRLINCPGCRTKWIN